jgi:hypothetical protein
MVEGILVDGGTRRLVIDREYHPGGTVHLVEDPDRPTLHDFENLGDHEMRISTVGLPDPVSG